MELHRLLDIQAQLGAGRTPGPGAMRFAPVVGTPSLPAFPLESLASGVAATIPLLAGTCLDELRFGMLLSPAWRDPDHEIDEATLVGAVRTGLDDPAAAGALIARYRELRPGASRFSLMLDILSDQFRIRTMRLADAKAHGGAAPVHVYLCALHQDTPMRAFHTTEVPLFFANVGASPEHPDTPAARRAERVLGDALVRFARDELPVTGEWPAYTPDSGVVLTVTDDEIGPIARPWSARLDVWEGVVTSARTDPWQAAFR